MKFKVSKEDVILGLDIVTRIVGSNNTLPILDNVLIEVNKEASSITKKLDFILNISKIVALVVAISLVIIKGAELITHRIH